MLWAGVVCCVVMVWCVVGWCGVLCCDGAVWCGLKVFVPRLYLVLLPVPVFPQVLAILSHLLQSTLQAGDLVLIMLLQALKLV